MLKAIKRYFRGGKVGAMPLAFLGDVNNTLVTLTDTVEAPGTSLSLVLHVGYAPPSLLDEQPSVSCTGGFSVPHREEVWSSEIGRAHV